MKAMKGLNMNRVFGSVRRRGTSSQQDSTSETDAPSLQLGTPEENAGRSVRQFCESGGPNNSGEEVLYLPTIVEAAESSPIAAKECAQAIRKFLKKDLSRPYVQYNAIMLMRILADNPGPTFTRNLDKRFVETVKELLRYISDQSVKQILMETLDNFEREKAADENLRPLMEMWKKEQEKLAKQYGRGTGTTGSRILNVPAFDPHSQNYFSRSHNTNRGLPDAQELASRIEEARTSAKLLTQVVQSTPPAEFLQNDLIKEFADRCLSASRSVQGYINSQNPAPDNDTMLTLIETNEQLALAMSKHQRAILQTRKALGLGSESPSPGTDTFAPPPGPPPSSVQPSSGPPPSSVQPSSGPPPLSSKPPPGLPPSSPKSPTVPSRKSVPLPATIPVSNPGLTSPELDTAEKIEDPFRDPTSTSKQYSNEPPTHEFSGMAINSYHPGFNPTQSYIGRQDSAVGHTAMHGAGERDSEGEEDEYTVPAQQTRKTPIYRY